MEEDLHATKTPSRKEWLSFSSLILIQSQNAFNEKAAQFLLIPLAAWLWNEAGNMEYALGAIIGLPYLLFSPLVGWLADCFCKARIIQFMTFLQIGVMALMWHCFVAHDIYGAILWFCIFAIQATILSPARKGIVKDMVGSRQLGFASGIVEMSIIFSILAAQIGIFIWFDELLQSTGDGWHAAAYPTMIMILVAVPVAIASLFLPRYPVTQKKPFKISLFYEHFLQIKFLWRQRNLRLSEIGISYFWFLAGVLILITIQIAKDVTSGDVGFGWVAAILMAWLSGGVIVGGVIASIICHKKIELGLIPLGAIGLTAGCIFTSFFEPMTLGSNLGFSITGAFASAYLVPLNAYLQDNCEPSSRGNVIAAGNLLDMLMGLIAVGFQMVMKEFIPIQQQFIVLSFLGLGITIVALRLIPREFIRMIGLWGMRFVYRARIMGQNNIPEYGGVIIISNHVTYGDALFLSMVFPRPIRFIVAEEFVTLRWLGWLLELFNCLPISSRKPREALSKAIQALKDGEVICIFPEGQLTRTGTLCAARRGLELMARKSHCPIVPIYMDGLWGSVFSYSGNRFFSKKPRQIPYRFTAAIGEPLDPQTVTSVQAINVLRRLSADCLDVSAHIGRNSILAHLENIGTDMLVTSNTGELTGNDIAHYLINESAPPDKGVLTDWVRQFIDCCGDRDNLNRLWINAQQIDRVNSFLPGETMLTTVGNGENQEAVVAIFWPILTNTPVYLLKDHDSSIPAFIRQIAGGFHLRKRLYDLVPPRRLQFYDFSNKPSLTLPNTTWKPCFCSDKGCVISMSMCHGVFKLDDGTVQLGMRPRTLGRLLPGFYQTSSNASEIMGPSLKEPYSLPPNTYLDESGFLAELQSDSKDS